MKNSINTLFALAVITVLSGCEKVIDLEVDNAAPRIVIEGSVFNGPGPFTVKVTRTASFYDGSAPVGVGGALVRISDSAGNSEVLTEGPDGTYLTSTLEGVEGRTYDLEVQVEGQVYTACNSMPTLNLMDSLTYDYLDSTDYVFLDVEDFGEYITVYHQDPGGVQNWYQFRVYLHGELDKPKAAKNTFSDLLIDGLQNTELLLAHPFFSGDTVTVELWNIDRTAYAFFTTLNEVSNNNGGGPFSGIPDNPTTNLSNDALGFFGAYAVDRRTIVIE